jgi:hypothetical protein
VQLLCQTCNRSKSDNCCCKAHGTKLDGGSCDIYGVYNKPATTPKPAYKATKTYSTQCTAYTQKGTRCKNMTKNASGRCYLH